ncbi:hypothetical protein AB1Y20_008552 [Prymnesium parvum]|uniref:Protein kinase domain-containing protein n=1 Tax=Prymnesium parvum TaxID=97485 RepID=A0AB34IRF8_PRYPA
MSAAALSLEQRGVPWQEVVIGGFACSGTSIQFAGSHLIAPGFPGVIVTSHVIDLASKMGVRLATAYFDKLSALVQAVASGAHGALDPDWLRAPEAQYHSDDVYVRRGALRFESKRDFHTSLRGALFMYAQLHEMPFVCTPIGMASGMHTLRKSTSGGWDRVAEDGNKQRDLVHLAFHNIRKAGFSNGFPPRLDGAAYIQALEKHLSEIHRQGIVHGNVTSKAVFWKLDAARVAMQIVDWDRSFFAADGPSPMLKAEWMKEHPAKYQIAESGDKYERVDLLYCEALASAMKHDFWPEDDAHLMESEHYKDAATFGIMLHGVSNVKLA